MTNLKNDISFYKGVCVGATLMFIGLFIIILLVYGLENIKFN